MTHPTDTDTAKPGMTEADIADALKRYNAVVDTYDPKAVIHELAKAVCVLLAEAGNLRSELAKRDERDDGCSDLAGVHWRNCKCEADS